MQYRFPKSVHKFFSERSENDHLHTSIKSYNSISSVLDGYYELDFCVPNFSMYFKLFLTKYKKSKIYPFFFVPEKVKIMLFSKFGII